MKAGKGEVIINRNNNNNSNSNSTSTSDSSNRSNDKNKGSRSAWGRDDRGRLGSITCLTLLAA